MKNIIFLCLLFLGVCQFANSQNKAIKIFENNLLIVENYLNGKKTKIVELQSSAEFLREISGIEYYINFDSYELSEVTSKKDLRKWKKWLKKNGENLYWDENEEKVKLKKN
jgi:hypothetical protein